jgi:hypothetical protein
VSAPWFNCLHALIETQNVLSPSGDVLIVRLKRRIELLDNVLGDDGKKISARLSANHGDLAATVAELKGMVPDSTLKSASLIHSLAPICDEPAILSVFVKDQNVSSLRDVALEYDQTKIAAVATSAQELELKSTSAERESMSSPR